jgi:hypothetical protein
VGRYGGTEGVTLCQCGRQVPMAMDVGEWARGNGGMG